MTSFYIYIAGLFCINFVRGNECDINDRNCKKTGAIAAYPVFTAGVENIVESSDPLKVKSIHVNLPSTKCILTNTELSGFKNCEITMVKVFKEKSTLKFDLHCPQFEVNADYSLLGHVGDMFVAGEGILNVICNDYLFIFTGYYEKNKGADDKEHVHIKKYFLEFENSGKTVIDFQDQYDKQKGDAVNSYMNKDWKAVDKAYRSPVLNPLMDKFIDNLNNFLSITSIEEVLPDI